MWPFSTLSKNPGIQPRYGLEKTDYRPIHITRDPFWLLEYVGKRRKNIWLIEKSERVVCDMNWTVFPNLSSGPFFWSIFEVRFSEGTFPDKWLFWMPLKCIHICHSFHFLFVHGLNLYFISLLKGFFSSSIRFW